ncbi:MAG: M14 family metallopeptidase, partial [Saprospiraceae bacterium]
NTPINMSPWYAFKLWADSLRTIRLVLHYENGRHRYPPKISHNGRVWSDLDSTLVQPFDSTGTLLTLHLGPDTLWLAGQEVTPSAKVEKWVRTIALHPAATFQQAGLSKQGRPLFMLDINEGPPKKKDIIVVLSRQHPPEVTGYFAMQAFIEELMADNPLANAFRRKYHLLVFPLMNPDGVDNGHWRHNAGGIDLNRDWAYYYQPETRQVADFIVKTARQNKSQVILGLDFHSTWQDVYYTFDESLHSMIHGFKDYWLQGIEQAIPGYEADDRPSGLNQPISKTWFYTQFGAESLTYEIGDTTPRDFIRQKGRVSAVEMMELLIFREAGKKRKK